MQLFMHYFPNFLLIFCRITAFFVVVPIFSTRTVPSQFKIGIAFFVSLIIFTSIGTANPVDWDAEYILSIIREILIGLLLGFVAYLFFTVVQIAGGFIDMQMGFSIANVIDPMTGASSPILGNFKFIIAILLFLSFNGHHYLIQAIISSYEWVPLSNELFARMYSGDIADFLIRSVGKVFALGFQLAIPVVAALFLVDLALGILSKTVPQLNIFVIGMPVKVIVGFMILIILIPGFLFLFQDLFTTLFESMQQLLHVIRG